MQTLQREWPHDQFEITMRYCAINAETNAPMPMPQGRDIPPGMQFVYLPRIRCLDCPGKLYTPGPNTTLSNFEVHLRNRAHRDRVNARAGHATGSLADLASGVAGPSANAGAAAVATGSSHSPSPGAAAAAVASTPTPARTSAPAPAPAPVSASAPTSAPAPASVPAPAPALTTAPLPAPASVPPAAVPAMSPSDNSPTGPP